MYSFGPRECLSTVPPHLDSFLPFLNGGPLPRVLPVVGLSGLEPPTSRLSGVRSNRLSYKPISLWLEAIRLFLCPFSHTRSVFSSRYNLL
jgi:hypothetical protein